MKAALCDSGEVAGGLDGLISVHQFAESLGRAMAAKALWAGTHSEEVARIAEILGRAMSLPAETVKMIHLAGHLHDIGKIGIPDHILKKDGPLTPAEWEQMRRHPAIGYAILKPVQAMTQGERIADLVLAHHERFDGSGYPLGLAGEAIPLGARVIAVADAMSAMTSHRRYRREDPWQEAVAEIRRCGGSHFDPQVVQVFLAVEGELHSLLRDAAATILGPTREAAVTSTIKGNIGNPPYLQDASSLGPIAVPVPAARAF